LKADFEFIPRLILGLIMKAILKLIWIYFETSEADCQTDFEAEFKADFKGNLKPKFGLF
jgi:hypothetical protein